MAVIDSLYTSEMTVRDTSTTVEVVKDTVYPIFIMSSNEFEAFEIPQEKLPYKTCQEALNSFIKPIEYFPSVFVNHKLRPKEKQVDHEVKAMPIWIITCIALCLIILAIVKSSVPKRMSQIFKGLVSTRYITQMKRESATFFPKGSFELNLNYLINFSLLVYIVYAYFVKIQVFNWSISQYLLVFVCFIGLYVLKIIAYQILGTLLFIKKQVSEFNANLSVFKEVMGILLLPINLILLLNPPQQYPYLLLIILIILLVYYIFRFIRSFIILSDKSKFLKFYLFLYLCTFEVVPFVILAIFITRLLKANV